MWVNLPATQRRSSVSATSRTWPLRPGASKAATRFPEATSTLVRFDTAVPFARENEPPTYTEVPSAEGRTAYTVPLRPRSKSVETRPVAASKAKTPRRSMTAELFGFCTSVKLPPTTMCSPTWASELTVPLRMFGVLLAGSSLTMRPSCGAARPGAAASAAPGPPRAAPVSTISTARTPRAVLRMDFPQLGVPWAAHRRRPARSDPDCSEPLRLE